MALTAADVTIVGGGLAGLLTALHLAPLRVRLLAASPLGEGTASAWAQGGIAAAMAAEDSAADHATDTLAAADGLADPDIVRQVTGGAPAVITELSRLGVAFDRAADGGFVLGLEAAHGRPRILHAGGDASGQGIMRAVIAAARAAPSIEILEGARALALACVDGAVAGVWFAEESRACSGGDSAALSPSAAVVLATGGIGQLYRETTNPGDATGSGLALAARAGARLADLEFVQFHPTALAVGRDPAPLATEALRGAGAVLIDERGRRLMSALHADADLAPRDVVARAVFWHQQAGGQVFLDARQDRVPDVAARFPTVAALCGQFGVDPAIQPIPVTPAAHYHMGGIAVDGRGRSSLAGLWACGEAAATGLHGANRLASNSLLEAAVFAGLVATDIAGQGCRPTTEPGRILTGDGPPAVPAPADPGQKQALRAIMSDQVGVVRDGPGLERAVGALAALERRAAGTRLADQALVARLIATAALARRESRGAHCRADFPRADPTARRGFLDAPGGAQHRLLDAYDAAPAQAHLTEGLVS